MKCSNLTRQVPQRLASYALTSFKTRSKALGPRAFGTTMFSLRRRRRSGSTRTRVCPFGSFALLPQRSLSGVRRQNLCPTAKRTSTTKWSSSFAGTCKKQNSEMTDHMGLSWPESDWGSAPFYGSSEARSMARIVRAVRRGIKAAHAPQRRRFLASGRIVVRSQCHGDFFKYRGRSLDRQYMLQCEACTHVEYFGSKPKEITEEA